MRKTLRLLPLALLLSCSACGTPTPQVVSAAPPPELVQPLPAEPAVPATTDEYAVGSYIVALRDYGRTVAARFNALEAWATTPAKP